jgi:hypothetical protein
MKSTIAKTRKCLGLLVCLGVFFAVQPAFAEVAPTAPTMTLVSTDTNEMYPFAAIVVAGATYHVTEGDKFFGQEIVRITPGHVTFRNRAMLSIMRSETFTRIAANEANAIRR